MQDNIYGDDVVSWVEAVRPLPTHLVVLRPRVPVDPEIRANTRTDAENLRQVGAHVDEVEIAWKLEDVKRTLSADFGNGLAAELLELDRQQPNTITPYTLDVARKGVDNARHVDAETGQCLARAVQARLDAVFDRFDALIMPTMGATAFTAGEDYVDHPLAVDGVELEHFSDASLTPVFNICSAHPVVAVLSGWAANGVPTGVQIATSPYDDSAAFTVAAALDRVTGAGFHRGRTPAIPRSRRA